MWDHDLPVYPNLVTVTRDGKPVDAVAQVTKTGYVFLFDRETGKPLFDIKERPCLPPTSPASRPRRRNRSRSSRRHFRAVSRRDEYHRHRSGQPRVGARSTAKDPRRSGVQSAQQARDGRRPGLSRRSELVGGIVRSDDRAACTSTRTMSPNIITLVETKAGDGTQNLVHIAHGLRAVPRPRGLLGDEAAMGQLNAINLNTGEFAWRVPLGEHVELTARGIPRTGTETFGGSIVTAGGLVFIAGTKDERIHAFDKETGKLLWEHPLPAGGYATPATYQVNGQQYVVIAAGGAGKLQTKAGDAFVAFRLRAAD